MRNMLVVPLVLILGCATTPPEIKSISTANLQLMNAMREDVAAALNANQAEVEHWVDLSFGLLLQQEEDKLKDADGNVNLDEYKKLVSNFASKSAETKNKINSSQNRIQNSVSAKFDKALILQALLDKYEQSTGVEPETINALVQELGATATDALNLYNQYQESKPVGEPSLEDRLNLVLKGKMEQIVSKIETGQPILNRDENGNVIVPKIPNVVDTSGNVIWKGKSNANTSGTPATGNNVTDTSGNAGTDK